MNFQLSKSQKEIQKAAKEFAKGEFDKNLALEQDKIQNFPETIRHNAAELGFIGIHFPEKYYGGGFGVFENALLAEEFCKKDSSMGMGLMLSSFASECILRFGSDELKEKFLIPIADSKILSGAAFTESNSGYDITSLATTAVRDKDEWVINGKKAYVVNGGKAGFYCVLCKTDLESSSSNSISMILVECDRDGLSVVNARSKLGMRMSALSDLEFRNVRVPCTNLIGKKGRGISQAEAFYDESRILTAAMALGTARGTFTRALDYVKQREQFGKKIGQFEVTRHKLADMAMQIEQAAFLTYSTAINFDRKKSDSAMIAMAKISACSAALNVSSEAIQLLGGYGYMSEYEVERCYRDSKVLEVFCGNTKNLKEIIAKNIVGNIR